MEEDNNSRCIVCSLKKDVFERNGLVMAYSHSSLSSLCPTEFPRAFTN